MNREIICYITDLAQISCFHSTCTLLDVPKQKCTITKTQKLQTCWWRTSHDRSYWFLIQYDWLFGRRDIAAGLKAKKKEENVVVPRRRSVWTTQTQRVRFSFSEWKWCPHGRPWTEDESGERSGEYRLIQIVWKSFWIIINFLEKLEVVVSTSRNWF